MTTEISTVIDANDDSLDPQTAAAAKKIAQLRQSIDNVDNAIVSLLAERFKATAQVGVLKAEAGFAAADFKRENAQMTRLRRVATEAGLDVEIAEKYREFVVEEAKKRHRRIAEEGKNPGVLDLFA
ncbi:MAG: chorismate mutase [Bifidobacteriaceae bacterium]|nr:chorismate mutase [Bifidobacteriaceae bacterium]MCI1915096.1 chorismate mutase [Bifidobacteriaceae bacterium]